MLTPRKPGETDATYLRRLAADGDAGERLRADQESEDLWRLQQDDGESADDYALRALALDCDGDYCRRISRRSLAVDAAMGS